MAVCIMAPVGGGRKGKKKLKSNLLLITKLLSAAKGTELRPASIIKGGKGAVSNLWADVYSKDNEKNPPPPAPLIFHMY